MPARSCNDSSIRLPMSLLFPSSPFQCKQSRSLVESNEFVCLRFQYKMTHSQDEVQLSGMNGTIGGNVYAAIYGVTYWF